MVRDGRRTAVVAGRQAAQHVRDTPSVPAETAPSVPIRWLLALAVASGAAALSYEVLWARMLALVAGHSLAALSVVTATFMAGLALGGLLGECPRLRRLPPLVLYGILEIGIGLHAAAMPWLLALVDPLADRAYLLAEAGGPHASGAPAATALHLAWAALLLIGPTTLMGATLPALVRAGTPGPEGGARSLARLYAANSLGGALGALVVTFVLLPALGHRTTGLVLAGCGLLIGAAALAPAASRRRSGPAHGMVEQPVSVSGEALLVVMVSGAAGLALEVAWTRAFILFIGSSTYAFSMILAAFIGGLSAGSHAAGLLMVRARPKRARAPSARAVPDGARRHVGLLLVALGGAGLASLAAIGRVPEWTVTLYPQLPGSFGWLCAAQLALVAIVTLPATFVLGMLLPLAARLPGAAGGTGHLCAANTAGAVAGSLAASLVTIPASGLAGTIGAASLAPATLGAFLLAPGRRLVRASALAAAGLIALRAIPPWDVAALDAGLFLLRPRERSERPSGTDPQDPRPGGGRRPPAGPSGPLPEAAPTASPSSAGSSGPTAADAIREMGRILFHREGPAVTVAVRESGRRVRTLLVNGKPDASTLLDMKTQRFIGHLPVALAAPPVRDVLVIGLGSGVSAGSVLRHPVESVTIVELSREVVEASRYFNPESGAPLSDRRARLILGDGRTHVFRTPDTYDVIVSEPTNPWISGVCSLFTQEFFTRCRDRLRSRGVMAQWLQAYDLSLDDFASVVRTFGSVFPGATLWRSVTGADFILIGARNRPSISVASLRAAFAWESVRRDATDVEVRDELDLLAHFHCGPAGLEALGAGARLQLDDRLDLEFTGPRKLRHGTPRDLLARLEAVAEPVDRALAEPLSPAAAAELELRRDRYRAYDLLRDGQLPEALEILASVESRAANQGIRSGFLKGFYLSACNMMQDAGSLDRAREVLETLLARFPRDADYQASLATVLCRQGEVGDARAMFERLVDRDPRSSAGHRGLGILDEARGDLVSALGHYRHLTAVVPHDPLAAAAVARVLRGLARHREADAALQVALAADPGLPVLSVTLPASGPGPGPGPLVPGPSR
jgi:spermidine synthase